MSNMQKETNVSEQYIGSQILRAIKRKALQYHPWSFYSDENNYEKMSENFMNNEKEKDILSFAAPIINAVIKNNNGAIKMSEITNIANITNKEIQIKNEFVIMTYEIAFATQLGFKIKENPDVVKEFSNLSFDAGSEFLENTDIEKISAQSILNQISYDTNMFDLIRWCFMNANTLKNVDKFGCTRYLLFSTKPMHSVGLSNKDNIKRKTIYSVQSVMIDGDIISITDADYDPETNEILDGGCHYNIKYTEDNQIQIGSSFWDFVKDQNKERLVRLMYSNCYVGIINTLSTIQELVERKVITKKAPDKEYHYNIDHIPSNVLKDGKIHYTKYEEHLSENIYYPESRKSPRLHIVKGYYKSNGTYVHSYPRGTDKELMSYVQNVIGEENIGEDGMARTLTPKQLDTIAPIIADELRKSKGKDSIKQIANKYKIDQSLVRSIARTRKTGLEEDPRIIDHSNKEENKINVEFVDQKLDQNNPVVEVEEAKLSEEIKAPAINIKPKTQVTDVAKVLSTDKSSVNRKTRVSLSDDNKIKMAEYYNSGNYSRSQLAEIFNVSLASVGRILVDLCEIDSSNRKQPNGNDIGYRIISSWQSGKFTTQVEVAKHLGISQFTVSKYLNDFYDNKVPTYKQIIASKNYKSEENGGEEDMRRIKHSNRKKHNPTNKKMNNHQYKKLQEEQEREYKAINEEIDKLELEPEENKNDLVSEAECIVKSNSEIIVPVVKKEEKEYEADIFMMTHKDLDLVMIKRPQTTVEVELVSNRHDTNINKSIFTGPLSNEEMFNFKWQEDVCNKFITDNIQFNEKGEALQTLILYCTGIQTCLASIDKVCYNRKVNLILKHYNEISKNYVSQIKWDCFGCINEEVFPFEKLTNKKGGLYGYKCDIKLLSKFTDIYCISLNVHDQKGAFLETYNILTTNIKDAWEIYPVLVSDIQTKKDKHYSVFMTSCIIKTNEFIWGDNISKSYNFK